MIRKRLCDLTEQEIKSLGFDKWSELMASLDKKNRTHTMPTDIITLSGEET